MKDIREMGYSRTGHIGPKTNGAPIVAQTIRFPAALHEEVVQAAIANRRSINSEILARLEKSK